MIFDLSFWSILLKKEWTKTDSKPSFPRAWAGRHDLLREAERRAERGVAPISPGNAGLSLTLCTAGLKVSSYIFKIKIFFKIFSIVPISQPLFFCQILMREYTLAFIHNRSHWGWQWTPWSTKSCFLIRLVGCWDFLSDVPDRTSPFGRRTPLNSKVASWLTNLLPLPVWLIMNWF